MPVHVPTYAGGRLDGEGVDGDGEGAGVGVAVGTGVTLPAGFIAEVAAERIRRTTSGHTTTKK
jgi:hypothetical protein